MRRARRYGLTAAVILGLLSFATQSRSSQITPATSGSPSDPAEGYVLDWENSLDRSLPDRAPNGWGKEYDPSIRHDGEPQIRAAQAPGEPVRSGRWSARFQLYKDDPPINNGTRAELSAAFEPVAAERWYGFSIYLPYTWAVDRSAEIVTQWHQDWSDPNICCSPPLAIVTRNGQWEISQNWEGYEKNTSVGRYETGRWTDWVVHVKWSADGDGVLDVWRDGQPVSGFSKKHGKNTYRSAKGNYLKIGIYKWDWSQHRPSDTTRRVMYLDELRIADQRGNYGGVAPR